MPQDAPNELPKAYDPALIEQKWATFWVDQHIFNVPTPTPQTMSHLDRSPRLLRT